MENMKHLEQSVPAESLLTQEDLEFLEQDQEEKERVDNFYYDIKKLRSIMDDLNLTLKQIRAISNCFSSQYTEPTTDIVISNIEHDPEQFTYLYSVLEELIFDACNIVNDF